MTANLNLLVTLIDRNDAGREQIISTKFNERLERQGAAPDVVLPS
jgi:hypothetical protein